MHRKKFEKQIFSSASAAEGSWEYVGDIDIPFTILLDGFNAGDIAQIIVTNRNPAPALQAPVDGDGQIIYRDNITAKLGKAISETYEYVRVRKSSAGGSPATTKADLFGIRKWAT